MHNYSAIYRVCKKEKPLSLNMEFKRFIFYGMAENEDVVFDKILKRIDTKNNIVIVDDIKLID